MKIAAWFNADEEERALVESYFPVSWHRDGLQADIVLSLFPRREMESMGIRWEDTKVSQVQLITAGANHMGWSNLPAHLKVGVTPGATGPFIAEYVLGAVLQWTRGFTRFTKAIGAGEFPLGAPVRALAGLKIGFLGAGGIYKSCRQVLQTFNCECRAVSQSGQGEDVALWDDRLALASWADVLVVCVPLVRSTEDTVDTTMLDALGDGLLINVARGPVVNEADLFAWLSRHGFAVLDVWWEYPVHGHPYTKPFHELDNVVMTPHNSPNVPGFRLAMINAACRLVLQTLQTGTLVHEVDRRGYSERGDGR